jgi:hypothetical protein
MYSTSSQIVIPFFFFRLSISENGCLNVLHHDNSQQILSKIVQSLGVDEAGNCLY